MRYESSAEVAKSLLSRARAREIRESNKIACT